jgi:hypothetical protein
MRDAYCALSRLRDNAQQSASFRKHVAYATAFVKYAGQAYSTVKKTLRGTVDNRSILPGRFNDHASPVTVFDTSLSVRRASRTCSYSAQQLPHTPCANTFPTEPEQDRERPMECSINHCVSPLGYIQYKMLADRRRSRYAFPTR